MPSDVYKLRLHACLFYWWQYCPLFVLLHTIITKVCNSYFDNYNSIFKFVLIVKRKMKIVDKVDLITSEHSKTLALMS